MISKAVNYLSIAVLSHSSLEVRTCSYSTGSCAYHQTPPQAPTPPQLHDPITTTATQHPSQRSLEPATVLSRKKLDQSTPTTILCPPPTTTSTWTRIASIHTLSPIQPWHQSAPQSTSKPGAADQQPSREPLNDHESPSLPDHPQTGPDPRRLSLPRVPRHRRRARRRMPQNHTRASSQPVGSTPSPWWVPPRRRLKRA